MRGQLPGSARPESDGNKETAKSLDDFDEVVFLADRDHTCPVCRTRFTSKVIKPGEIKTEGMDIDMRPRSVNADIIKYRVVECPGCGFADMEKYFNEVGTNEAALIKEKLIRKADADDINEISREYAEAYRYYRSALRCALIRSLKSSRRGYIALNTAWLLRGWREKLMNEGYMVMDTDPMSAEEEKKILSYTLRTFMDAWANEDFPVCGMDGPTFDYLIAALCYEQGHIADSQKYLLRCLQEQDLKPVLRTMAEELREMIRAKKGSTASS